MEKKFAIVKFPDEQDATGVIPLQWANEVEGYCFYPNVTTDEMRDTLIRNEAVVKEDWAVHTIVVLKKFASYSDARLKLRDAEFTSNLDSDDEEFLTKKRKRKPNKQLLYPDESDMSDDDSNRVVKKRVIPPYPQFPERQLNSRPADKKKFPALLPSEINVTEPSKTPENRAHLNNSMLPTKETPLKNTVEKLIRGQCHLQNAIASLNERLTSVDEKLDQILSILSSRGHEQPVVEEPELALLSLLPLSNKEDFQVLEDKLVEAPPLQNKLIRVFMTVGGCDIKHLSINIMRRCITDELAQTFSFTGKKGFNEGKKEAFASTHLFNTIQMAIRKTFKDGFSQEVTKKHITMWLSQAKTRLTRRAERCKSQQGSTDPEEEPAV